MEEVVRKFEYATRKNKVVKVRRPLGAFVAGIIILSIAGLTTAFFAVSFAIYFSEGEKLVGDELEGVIYLFVSLITIMIGAIAILMRKYKTGGTLCIIFGLLFAFGFWYVGVPIAILGLIALRGVDKIEHAILAKFQEIDSIPISELAQSLKKTEADIEIGVLKLIDTGENIVFDPETRLVTMKN